MSSRLKLDDPGIGRWVPIALALLVVFLWATSWVLIKIGLEHIPALTFAGLRYTLAFLFLLPVVGLARRRSSGFQLPTGAIGRLLVLGLLLYAVTQGAIFVALSYLPAVTVNLLWSFSTVSVALLGIVWLSERPTQFQWFGVGLATLGAIFYFYPVALPAGSAIGVLVSFIGVLANAAAAIAGREVNRARNLHPLMVTATSMGFGSIVLLAAGIAVQGIPRITLQGWAIIGWLAVVNTAFAFTLWNFTLRSLSATESSIINGTMLIWIPILAVVFLDESVSAKELVGLVVAGIGTLIVQLRRPGTIAKYVRGLGGRRGRDRVTDEALHG